MKLVPRTVDQLGALAMVAVLVGGLLLVVLPFFMQSGADTTRTAAPVPAPAAPTSDESEPEDEEEDEEEVRRNRTPKPSPTEQRTKKPKPGNSGERHEPPFVPLVKAPRVAPAQPVPVFADLVVSSFNVLGSSHTDGPNGRKGYASGTTRARYAAQLLEQHGVDIVGFQELQPDQMRVVQSATGGRYEIYPGMTMGREAGVNSLAWLRDVWTAVDVQTVTMPYFGGNPRELPLVRLRHNRTGLETWVANFHNPADAHGPAQRWRDEATRRQITLVNDLVEETSLPVIFTGDFNDREQYFCPLVGGTPMEASNGGSVDGSCRPPSPMHVDWIFATPEVSWLGHLADRGPLVQRTTDHPMIVARGRLDGLLTPDGRVDPQTLEETRRAMERVSD